MPKLTRKKETAASCSLVVYHCVPFLGALEKALLEMEVKFLKHHGGSLLEFSVLCGSLCLSKGISL